ncbi:MAG: hypothetical protein JW983_04565 [Elusimicrobia bacterium]|nr:hypothetical protein [Elusimicrobiota bacterium]
MKCYNHPEKDAAGICKHCSKGLCKECAVDVGGGLACINSCEDEVREVNKVISQSKTVYQKAGKSYTQNAVIYGLLGFFFLLFGIGSLLLVGGGFPALFLIIPGIIFLLGAFFCYSSGKKIGGT